MFYGNYSIDNCFYITWYYLYFDECVYDMFKILIIRLLKPKNYIDKEKTLAIG